MATRSSSEVGRVLRALARFTAIFVLIWFGFYEFQNTFPYFQAGADVIVQTKLRFERAPHLFKKPDALKLLFFGNSKALSGFVPKVFDTAMGSKGRPTESYNLGLPAYNYFVDRLESILAARNVPNYILITVPWTSNSSRTDAFHFIPHDSEVINELFPFHTLAREALTTSFWSIRSHGLLAYYETNRMFVERMLADRGYFFVYDSIRFPNKQLPVGFKAPVDDPGAVYERQASTRNMEFQKLNRLLEAYRITCLLVPIYFRVGQCAPPPPENTRLAAELAQYPRLRLLGPDYVLFDNRYFSDQSHLKPEGALLYTRYIAELVAPTLR